MTRRGGSARRLQIPPEKRYLLTLLYWPAYTAAFFALERLIDPAACAPTECALDALIPFNERFIVVYLLWFPFWIGMLAYCLAREPATFRRTMGYFMLTFSAALLTCWLFPTRQSLRPAAFPRENVFAALTGLVYRADTSTNVCPSEHVIGAMAVVFAARDSRRFSSPGRLAAVAALALLICASTLLVKQHAVLDIVAAAPYCLAGWLVCFRRGRRG